MVIVDEQGSYRGILSMWEIVDILNQYLDYLERMLDNIDDGIIAIDEKNKIIYMNKTYRQIHSIEDNELIGKNVQENFPESRLMEISEANDNIIVEDPLHLNFSGATVMPLYKALKGDDEKYLGAAAIIKDYNEANSIYICLLYTSKKNWDIPILERYAVKEIYQLGIITMESPA